MRFEAAYGPNLFSTPKCGHPERKKYDVILSEDDAERREAEDESKDLHLALRAEQLLWRVPFFTQIDPRRIALLD